MAVSGHAPIMVALRRILLVAGVSGLAGILIAGLALPIAAGLGLVARESANGFSEMPNTLDATRPLPERSRILDADGNLIATFYDDNRVYRELDEIAPVFQDAVLAIEDHRFFSRGPIDFQSTARAFVTNLEEGEIEEGGSTLTQQYAKKLAEAQATTEEEQLAATELTYARKLRELRLAVGLEQQLTKEEILEGYLNLVYFGAGAHGVEAAARRYFSTSAADLTLVQAATLAGIIQRPTAYDPTRNPEATRARRDVVLRRMADLDFISEQELEEALEQPLELDEQARPNGCVGSSSAPFFCDYVYRELVGTSESGGLEALGETPAEREQALRQGGLTIRTTLSRDAQRAANRAVSDRVAPTDTAVAALASVEPGTGQIKAMTHSRGYGDGEGETYLNYAVDADMGGGDGAQPGSGAKVWVLAAAIEQGIALNMTINSPYQVRLPENSFETCDGPYSGTGVWEPRNYDTGLSGLFDLRSGTELSVNTFYAQLEQQTGLCDPVRIATEAGLTHASGAPLKEQPSFVLGAQEVSPLSQAEAYAMFAARGVHCESYAVQQVEDRNGEVIYEAEPECNRVMAEEHADGVNDVLKGVIYNGGTGARMRLSDGRDAAGKTGTTNNTVAVWWNGYIPQLATSVAVFPPEVSESGELETLTGRSFNGEVIYDVCGGCVPGPIWLQMYEDILDNYERESFTEPDPTVVAGALTTVPDVRGRSQSEAEDVLREAGFRAHVADEEPSELPEGTVVTTEPEPGSRYPSGGSIGLVLSSGEPPDDDDDDDDDGPGRGNGPPDEPPVPDEDGDQDEDNGPESENGGEPENGGESENGD